MNEIATNTRMKRVGDMLRTARERKNLTHAECYKFIRIHPKYLEALENGEYKAFSGSVHVKGFLKIYAKLLDLNVDEVMAFWRREYDEKSSHVGRIIKPLEHPKFLITPTFVVVGFTLLLVVGFFVYLFYQYKSFTGNPLLELQNPVEDMTVTSPQFKVAGKTDRDSTVFINGQKISVNPDGSFVVDIDLADGLNPLNFYAVNSLGKETRFTSTVVLKKELAEVKGEQDQQGRKIKLEVKGEGGGSFVEISSDSVSTLAETILDGETKVFEASESIKIKTKSAGNISLRLNGVELGIFGKTGEEKEQEFR